MSCFYILIFIAVCFGPLWDNLAIQFLEDLFCFVALIAGISGIIHAILDHAIYFKKIDFKIKSNSIVVPNPSRKDIIFSKKDNPYSIPYESIRHIRKDTEVTSRMKWRGEKEPRKVCIIKKKNGDKIKIRPDYLEGDFDEFVDNLKRVYEQNKGRYTAGTQDLIVDQFSREEEKDPLERVGGYLYENLISMDQGTKRIFKDNWKALSLLYPFYFSIISILFYFTFVSSPFVIKSALHFYVVIGCFISFVVTGIVVNSYYTKTYIEREQKISFYKMDPTFLYLLLLFLLFPFGFSETFSQEDIGLILILIIGLFVVFLGILNLITPKKLVIDDEAVRYTGRRRDDEDFEVKLSDIEEVNVNGMLAKNHGLEIITEDETYNCSLGNQYNRLISEMIKERM